jgi:hypothetical protein
MSSPELNTKTSLFEAVAEGRVPSSVDGFVVSEIEIFSNWPSSPTVSVSGWLKYRI